LKNSLKNKEFSIGEAKKLLKNLPAKRINFMDTELSFDEPND